MDWILFGSALSSATVLPGSSELLLLARLQEGADPVYSVTVATLGNVLGSTVTFATGLLGLTALQRYGLRISPTAVERAGARLRRFGWPSLLLTWLPGLGDALCLAAGALRFPLPAFVCLVTVGKAARYVVLAALFAAG